MNFLICAGVGLAGYAGYRSQIKLITLTDDKDQTHEYYCERGWFQDRLWVYQTSRVQDCLQRHWLMRKENGVEIKSLKTIHVDHVQYDRAAELDAKLDRACKQMIADTPGEWCEEYLTYFRRKPDPEQVRIALQKIVDQF